MSGDAIYFVTIRNLLQQFISTYFAPLISRPLEPDWKLFLLISVCYNSLML
jgi:hypothetical protein